MVTALLAVAFANSPAKVEIVSVADGFELRRNGQPYWVQGAGAPLPMLDSLRAAGANSVRTWGADGLKPLLDRAHALGMTVTIGIWLPKKEEGFNYTDPAAVQRLVDMARERAREYRDHPALLMWGIGNEMELGQEGPEVYQAVEKIAAAVKAEDPHHPVMTVVADMWPEKMAMLLKHCPSLDLLGVNTYGGVSTVHERLKDWKKPYILTEFAFNAPFDAAKTPWNVPIEPSTTEKAQFVEKNYRDSVLGRRGRALGSYLFYWGKSDSSTSAWFTTHLKTGEKTATVDTMTRLWSGQAAKNLAPRIERLEPSAPQTLKPGAPIRVRLVARDPEGDRLTYRYEIITDDPSKRFVGDFEKPTDVAAQGETRPRVDVVAPRDPGPYRLVLFVKDGKGGAAVATLPFLVRP